VYVFSLYAEKARNVSGWAAGKAGLAKKKPLLPEIVAKKEVEERYTPIFTIYFFQAGTSI